ncbi:Soluble cytochrome b562 [Citrobacter freundii]|nr:Soluble cytochrome b562 [Citrobacter freundii]
MKKYGLVLLTGITLLYSGVLVAGSDSIEHAMKQMNKSYRAALKDNDVASFRQDIQAFHKTAESVLNSPPEGYDRETYMAGISLLIDEAAAVDGMAEKNGLEAGRVAAQKLGSLMRKYHDKLGVD